MSTKAFKQEKIDAYKSNLEKATVAVVTNYSGLTVEEITNLRRELQKNDADYTVTKNTLAKLAIKGTKFEALEEVLKGSTAIAFGFSDQQSVYMASEIENPNQATVLLMTDSFNYKDWNQDFEKVIFSFWDFKLV